MVGVERVLQVLIYLSAIVGVMPVWPFLDWWVQLVLLFALLLGMVGDLQRRYLLNHGGATLLSVVFFGWFLFQVSLTNLVAPSLQLLCLLLAVRLASSKSPRNFLQIFLLSTMVLAASSLLTLDMGYLVYLVLIVFLVTSGLVLLSFYASEPLLRFSRQQWLLLLKVNALLPVGSLLLMLLLFVILPRTQTPLWNFLNPKAVATVGMSDQVSPGSVAALAQSGQIAFRAETERLPQDALYWRGIVFNRLEGQTWKRRPALAAEKPQSDPASETLVTIYSQPKADHYLITLDQPRKVENIRHNQSADNVVSGRWRDNRKISYQVRAQYHARSRQTGNSTAYLQLPGNLSPRLLALGTQMAAGQGYQGKINLVEGFFLQQQLSYSTEQLPFTEHAVESFLFESKRGYCEYFASSFAVLLRLAGVPARLVGGYLGGEYNQFAGYYLVAEDSAHVWVEALDDNNVWQRLDPSRLAINANQALLQPRQRGIASLRAFSDAMLHNWSRLVLNYDLHQQFGLVRQVAAQVRDLNHFDRRRLWHLLWLLPFVLPFALLHLRRRAKTRVARLVNVYRQQVAKCAGLDSLPAEVGLFALAQQSEEPLCQEFAEILGAAVYRDRPLAAVDFRRLQQIISSLNQRKFAIEVALPASLGDNNTPETIH